MHTRYKDCTNIKTTAVLFCYVLLITLPLLANNQWKTKFPKLLTISADTIPVKNIDTVQPKKIIADSLKPLRIITNKSDSSLRKDSSFFNKNDSLGSDTVVISADTTLFSKDSINAPIHYTAEDSGVLIIPQKQFILYGKANADYGDIKLDANTIQYDQQSSLITAFGGTDTSKGPLNLPTFTQNGSESKMDTVLFNLKSKKGLTKNTYYKEGEMFVNAQVVKKVDENTEYAFRGRFTTCNLDTPHFDIRARKMKIINNKLAVSGPAFPEFEGVPIPIPIPFGIYPLNRGRHSGLLPPRFTTSDSYGLGLEGLGFYKVISDDWDVTTTADLYSYGGWRLQVAPKYYKRYRYRGSFSISAQHTKFLNTTGLYTQEFTTSNSYNIVWSHSTDSKARPGTSFSASVNAGSTQYNRYSTTSALIPFDNNLSSSVNYNKTWGDRKYNLAISANESQNSNTRFININAPNATFNVSTIYPFQGKDQVGGTKWYQKLGIGYTGSLTNSIPFYDSAFNFRNVLDTIQWSADHVIPITLALPPIGPVILAPSVSYEERWYAQKIVYTWNGPKAKIDTTLERGFFAARQASFGVSANTRVFGTFNFGQTKIRHEIDPFVGLNYTPSLVKQYYQTVQTTVFGKKTQVSQLSSGTFSNVPFGGLSFGINNLLEMKTRNRKDSTGQDSVKKIRLLDNLSITGGYNLIADSLNWSDISIRAGSSLFNKINITATTTLHPYETDTFGVNHLMFNRGKLGQLSAGNLAISTSFQSKSKDKRNDDQRLTQDQTLTPDEQQQELQYVRSNPAEFVDFNIPWTVQLSYSLNYSRQIASDLVHYVSRLNSSINVNGDLSISPKWKIGGGFYYNSTTNKIDASSIFLTRDMHCWQMVMTINVSSYNKSFSITLNPKSGILRDLHINKRFLQQY